MKVLRSRRIRELRIFSVLPLLWATTETHAISTQQAYIKASAPELGFGKTVSLSGSTLAVSGSSALYIFSRTGTNWIQQARLTNAAANLAVAVQDNTVVLGSPYERFASDLGAVRVFGREGTNWVPQTLLRSPTGNADGFGASLALSGDTLVVGATSYQINQGAVYVFSRSGTNWLRQAHLQPTNTIDFGISVAMSGDTLVVGDERTAYVFTRSGTNWSASAEIRPHAGADGFGSAVAILGDTMVVGEPEEYSTGFHSGAAYVYERAGTNWLQQAKLKAPGLRNWEVFGNAVAIANDLVAVGASWADAEHSVNGFQTNCGAVYIYRREGTNWVPHQYLLASNAEGTTNDVLYPGDSFGNAVAIYGDTLAVGAFREDSAALGINGDQNDNSAENSGAVYVFNGVAIGPRLKIQADGGGGHWIRFRGLPGLTYNLIRAGTLDGVWTTNGTATANSSGAVEFHEANSSAAGQAFYRTVQPFP